MDKMIVLVGEATGSSASCRVESAQAQLMRYSQTVSRKSRLGWGGAVKIYVFMAFIRFLRETRAHYN